MKETITSPTSCTAVVRSRKVTGIMSGKETRVEFISQCGKPASEGGYCEAHAAKAAELLRKLEAKRAHDAAVKALRDAGK